MDLTGYLGGRIVAVTTEQPIYELPSGSTFQLKDASSATVLFSVAESGAVTIGKSGQPITVNGNLNVTSYALEDDESLFFGTGNDASLKWTTTGTHRLLLDVTGMADVNVDATASVPGLVIQGPMGNFSTTLASITMSRSAALTAPNAMGCLSLVPAEDASDAAGSIVVGLSFGSVTGSAGSATVAAIAIPPGTTGYDAALFIKDDLGVVLGDTFEGSINYKSGDTLDIDLGARNDTTSRSIRITANPNAGSGTHKLQLGDTVTTASWDVSRTEVFLLELAAASDSTNRSVKVNVQSNSGSGDHSFEIASDSIALSSDAVGIGTTSPSRPLNIVSTQNELIRLDNTVSGGDCVINYRTSFGTDVNWATGILASTDAFAINPSTNVAASSPLQVLTSGQSQFAATDAGLGVHAGVANAVLSRTTGLGAGETNAAYTGAIFGHAGDNAAALISSFRADSDATGSALKVGFNAMDTDLSVSLLNGDSVPIMFFDTSMAGVATFQYITSANKLALSLVNNDATSRTLEIGASNAGAGTNTMTLSCDGNMTLTANSYSLSGAELNAVRFKHDTVLEGAVQTETDADVPFGSFDAKPVKLATPTANRTWTIPTSHKVAGRRFTFINSATAASGFDIIVATQSGAIKGTANVDGESSATFWCDGTNWYRQA